MHFYIWALLHAAIQGLRLFPLIPVAFGGLYWILCTQPGDGEKEGILWAEQEVNGPGLQMALHNTLSHLIGENSFTGPYFTAGEARNII